MNLRDMMDAFQAASADEQREFAELIVDTVAALDDELPDYAASKDMRDVLMAQLVLGQVRVWSDSE